MEKFNNSEKEHISQISGSMRDARLKGENKEKTGKAIAKETLQRVYKQMKESKPGSGWYVFTGASFCLSAEEMKKLQRIISR